MNNNLIKWLTVFNTVAILLIGGFIGYLNFADKPKSAPNRAQALPKNINMTPLIQGGDYLGSENARVNIVVFNSFTCGFCRKSREVLHQVVNKYPDKVRLVYRHFQRNDMDLKAGIAAECAGDQNKFWQMYDQIYGDETGSFNFASYANKIGVDTNKFNQCISSKKYESRVSSDTQMGRALGVNGTPSFVINGEMMIGYKPFEVFEQKVKSFF